MNGTRNLAAYRLPGYQGVGSIASAFVVDAHPVDDGPVLGKPETAGKGIPFLGAGCQGAYLDEGEAEIGQIVIHVAVLVETGRQTDGMLEGNAEQFTLKSLCTRAVAPTQEGPAHRDVPAEFQQVHSHPVDILRLEEK